MPGETAAKVVQTKEPQHKDDFDEWLARIICYAFSVPPQWATKAMNRATADNQSAQSEEEGLEPTKEWVKDLIDEIVAEEFSSPDLELHWLDEDEGDPETVLEGRLKVGALTLNEMRDALGLDPFDNAAADRPMVLTATGFVPIEANAGGEGASANAGANGKSVPAVQKYSSDQPRVSAGNPDGGQWTLEGASSSVDDISGSSSGGSSADGAGQSNIPNVQLAAGGDLRCEGFAGGCQSGGSYGATAMYSVSGHALCMDCAVKMLGIQNESSKEKVLTLSPYILRR